MGRHALLSASSGHRWLACPPSARLCENYEDTGSEYAQQFEVPDYIITPSEVEEQRRQREEQAAKKARSKELAKARYEKRKADKREFTARKKAGLLTPEEQEAEEKRLAHNREW